MAALQFDGTDDELKWTTLAAALGNVSDGAWTCAAVVRRNSTGSLDSISTLTSTTNTLSEAAIGFASDNTVYTDVSIVDPDPKSTSIFTSTSAIYMLVLSKGAGNVAPRLAWKVGAAGAWTHEDLDAAMVDQIASTTLFIGAWQPFNGWIGVVAWWEGAMSDANKEALDNTWRTSDLWSSAHGQPVFLAECNKAGTSVVDLAGNATSLAVVGTTLDAAETLDGWTFDGIGRVSKNTRSFPVGLAPGLVGAMNR